MKATRCSRILLNGRLLLILVGLISIIVQDSLAKKNKCKVKYRKLSANHTICLPPKKNCVAMNTGVSQDEVKEILRLHNDYRQKAAQGLIRNLPPAADMMELVWDRELATIAQAHSSQCQFKHDCLDCRKVPRFATGQNMFRFKTNDPNPDEASDWVSAIASWEEKEEQFFDPSEVKKLRGRSSKAAHLSQVLWAKSVYLGCGQTKYKLKGEKHYQKLFTCLYGPQGNLHNYPVYEVGEGCSQCPKETTCSVSYPGLCSLKNKG